MGTFIDQGYFLIDNNIEDHNLLAESELLVNIFGCFFNTSTAGRGNFILRTIQNFRANPPPPPSKGALPLVRF